MSLLSILKDVFNFCRKSYDYFTPKFSCHIELLDPYINPDCLWVKNLDKNDLFISSIKPRIDNNKYGKSIPVKTTIKSGKSEKINLDREISFRSCKILIKRVVKIPVNKEIEVSKPYVFFGI